MKLGHPFYHVRPGTHHAHAVRRPVHLLAHLLVEIGDLVIAGRFWRDPHVAGHHHTALVAGLLVGSFHLHGENHFVRVEAGNGLLFPRVFCRYLELDISLLRVRRGLHLLRHFFHHLLHLREGHHGILFLIKVDLGDGFLVEVDDRGVMLVPTYQAVALHRHRAHHGLARLFRECAGEFHHAGHHAPGYFGRLVIAEISKNRQTGCNQNYCRITYHMFPLAYAIVGYLSSKHTNSPLDSA